MGFFLEYGKIELMMISSSELWTAYFCVLKCLRYVLNVIDDLESIWDSFGSIWDSFERGGDS